ncbi:MAG: SPOR domain-containing protein [Rhodobacteraceae bacterium]|nr:SPOR domain-containing protein [Paracoccaceae bacterium]
MADLDVYGFGPEAADDGCAPAAGGRVARITSMVGAAMSLALVAGLGYWGYDLMVRDVTGIPVIQAMEGPMRVQPDDPGGDRASHQGLAVNRIAAMGEAAPPPDEIVLAPRSVDLAPEDVPQAALRATPAVLRAPGAAGAGTARRAVGQPSDPVEAAILAAATGVMTAEADLAGDALPEALPASLPGLARSPRPRPRGEALAAAAPAPAASADAPAAAAAEAGLAQAAAVAPAAPAEAAGPREVDPASLPPGTRLVQFGAFNDPEEARAAWAVLGSRFGALMEGKDRVIEQAEAGGRTFFRLRAAGFEDLADARRFCAPLVAEGADCIPVLTR